MKSKKLFPLLLFLLIVVFSACEKVDLSKVRWEKEKFGQAIWLTESRLVQLRQKLQDYRDDKDANDENLDYVKLYRPVQQLAQDYLTRPVNPPKRWYVPGYYVMPNQHKKRKNGLRDDAQGIYALALVAAIENNEVYARRSLDLINRWLNTVETWSKLGDSRLAFSYHFLPIIAAADLLRRWNFWNVEQEQSMRRWLIQTALPMSSVERNNNWGNWGLSLSVAIASFTQNKTLFFKLAQRWGELLFKQMNEQGHLKHEVRRGRGKRGIWYSHFALAPQTLAAEIFRTNGLDLFQLRSISGKSLELAYNKVVVWTLNPRHFPYWRGDVSKLSGLDYTGYWEILQLVHPRPEVADYLVKNRPMREDYGVPFLSLTHSF